MASEDFALVLPFYDQSEPFAYGFECGRFYELMRRGQVIEDEPAHIVNRRQLEAIAKRYGYDNIDFLEGVEWMSVNGTQRTGFGN